MSKSGNTACYVNVQEDGFLVLTNEYGNRLNYETCARIINSIGRDNLLKACKEGDLKEAIRARNKEIDEKNRRKAELYEKYEAERNARYLAEYKWIEAAIKNGDTIEATYDNIVKVLRYLNSKNWGTWKLPKMSIGYRCNQYDCDGRQATTMILDKEVEGSSRYCYGAPRRYLDKYTHLTD